MKMNIEFWRIALAVTMLAGFLSNNCLAQIDADRSEANAVQDATKIISRYKPVVGKAHSDFILPSIQSDRARVQLSDFRGTKVLLLHFASW